MWELLEHPSVRERATEERSADEIQAASVAGSLRVTEHGYPRRRVTDRRLVAAVILWDEPVPPHGSNNSLGRCTFPKGSNERVMEHPLADVRLDGHKQRSVCEPPQESGDEHTVVGESKSESMEEHNRPCLGVFRIPVLRNANHVLDVPMDIKLNAPVTFQELANESVTDGDKDIPEEGAR